MARQDSWVKHVMDNYTSTDPPKGIFTISPKTIADAADVEGVAPKGLTSWQRMVIFHHNRGGKGLTHERQQTLQKAIHILSKRREERKKHTNGYEEKTLLPHKLISQKDFGKRLLKETRTKKADSTAVQLGAAAGQAAGQSAAVKPLAAIPTADGQHPKSARPQAPQPGQPNFQNMQPNPAAWRPSAVAQVAAAKGDPHAWIYNLFKPQQPQQAQQPKVASVLDDMAIKHLTHKPTVSTINMGKSAHAVATGDPLPKGFTGGMVMPTKANGGIGSYGNEAWDSFNNYRYSWAQPFDLRNDWHVKQSVLGISSVAPHLLPMKPAAPPATAPVAPAAPPVPPLAPPTAQAPGSRGVMMDGVRNAATGTAQGVGAIGRMGAKLFGH